MKKLFALLIAMVTSFSLMLTGCGSSNKAAEESKPNEPTKKEALKIVSLVNGNLGDKSFFDSANAGMEEIKKQFGAETKVIEMGEDQTKWEPTLADVSEEDWDIIIVGTWQMAEPLQKIAVEHQDKKYIIYDSSVDYTKGNLSNVYSINYKQNEGSFLAGALAAKITSSTMKNVNPEAILGFVGGMDIPVINDFLVGYIQGAKYVIPEVKVATSYIGDFFNSAKGKELALAQYNQKADIIFSVAGQAGLGTLDASKEQGKYAVGVDSDQSMLFKDSDPEKANLITTSVLKRVDNSLVRAIKLHIDGNLKYGEAENLGIKEECIGIANNEFYEKNISSDVRSFIDDLSKKIVGGEIVVDSAMGMETDKVNEIRNSVKP